MFALEPISHRLVAQFKAVRLRALQDTPTAFGSTYATESQLSEVDWLNRVTTWNSDASVCYIALENGAPCGIIAGYLDKKDPQRAHVVSMWVAPAQRRSGLGTALIDAVERWAHTLEAGELRLMVTNNNSFAIRFYEQCGFISTGVTKPYANDPELVTCEMVKLFIRRSL
jgi:ribosomal protein S18 acetylase RimI-like enzyme